MGDGGTDAGVRAAGGRAVAHVSGEASGAGGRMPPASFHVPARQVDGPSHYAVGTRTPLGNTVMKHRHLQQVATP